MPKYDSLKYVIASTGRCGTVSMAKLLTTVGIPCSHERMFNVNGAYTNNIDIDSDVSRVYGLNPGTPVQAEASFMSVPYLPKLNHGTKVIHLVREPVKVILSFNNWLQWWHYDPPSQWECFILRHLPEIRKQVLPLNKICYFVLTWNRLIEKFANIRIRIESDWDLLLDFLGIPNHLRINPETINVGAMWKIMREKLWKAEWSPLDKPATEEEILSGPFGKDIAQLRLDYKY